jgi:hypothetical protein
MWTTPHIALAPHNAGFTVSTPIIVQLYKVTNLITIITTGFHFTVLMEMGGYSHLLDEISQTSLFS